MMWLILAIVWLIAAVWVWSLMAVSARADRDAQSATKRRGGDDG